MLTLSPICNDNRSASRQQLSALHNEYILTRSKMTDRWHATSVFAAVSILLSSVCHSPAFAQSKAIQTVHVAQVQKGSTANHGRYVGRVEAIKTVDIKARVTGILEKREFKAGQQVKQGQLLFVIEKQTYLADVAKAKANLSGAQATLKNSGKNLEREKILHVKGDLPQSSVDTAQAQYDSDRANVQQFQALLDTANINLGYTEIYSPIDGRISKTNVNVGNLIESNTGTLATITTVDPVYVTFYLPEKALTVDRRTGLMGQNDSPLKVRVQLSDGSEYRHPGAVDYIATEVNQDTDTIEVRAILPNPKGVLIPNQFVKVSLSYTSAKKFSLIPQSAVQYDKKGHFVYTLDGANKVRRTNVSLGHQMAGDWQVKSGLKAGQTVIVQGLQKVRPGDTVKPVEIQR